jgi:hypothetical protein
MLPVPVLQQAGRAGVHSRHELCCACVAAAAAAAHSSSGPPAAARPALQVGHTPEASLEGITVRCLPSICLSCMLCGSLQHVESVSEVRLA